MKLVRIAAVVAAAGLVVAFSGVGRPDRASGRGSAASEARTITVSGTGSVEAVPDRAQFSFGVTTQATTASRALSTNAGLAVKVISAIKARGVPAADIRTESVQLSPSFSDDGTTIVGYTATNTVSATLRDLGKAGSIVDSAVDAGANQVFGPSLVRSDQNALYRTALRAAVANARAKAQALARASDVSLGAARSVVEGSSSPPPEPLAKGSSDMATATPIEPGTQTIEASVTVVFAVG
jgi:uncharacterized protein YggE